MEDVLIEDNLVEQTGDKKFSKLNLIFDKIYFLIFTVLAFLLPIFFVPVPYTNLFFSKQLIFGGAIILVLILILFSFLKKGLMTYQPSLIFWSAICVLGTTLLSTIFSGSISLSMFGQGFESGVWLSIFVSFFAVFLLPLIFNSKEKVFYGYIAMLCSVIFLMIFHFLRFIFGADFLDMGIFLNATSNTIGRFSDLGIIFGLTLIMSLILLELFKLTGLTRVFAYIIFFGSLIFLTIVNTSLLWVLTGLFSLILFVYIFSFSEVNRNLFSDSDNIEEVLLENQEDLKPKRKLPILTLGLLLLSVIFFLMGSYISDNVSAKLGVAQVDVRPSWTSTLKVAKSTLDTDPLFGVGLNKFDKNWLLFKDPVVNNTVFWDSNFDNGVGFVPTFAVTSGALGILAWLFFIFAFVYTGFRVIFSPIVDKIGRFLTLISFSGAMFLWCSLIFYAPGNTIILLTFLFTGLFLASLGNEGVLPIKTLDFKSKSKVSFISSILLIFAIIFALGLGYGLVKNFIANFVFQKAMYQFNSTGNLDQAEKSFNFATSLSKQDVFYQVLTDVGLSRVSNLLADTSQDQIEAKRLQFQNTLGITLEYAKQAIEIDNQNYANWLNLGKIYEAIVPLGIEGAYESARSAYEQAVMLNPLNPGIRLILARLELAKGNNDQAKIFINQAVSLKPNYTEAAYLWSQIEIKEGNTKGAIESLESATTLSPNDSVLFFQLGLLKYNNKDYKGAISSLGRAVALNPLYANAKYFLGLSYDKNNQRDLALKEFEDVLLTNPDNEEVKQIISNLKNGKSALSGISSAPETREEPPIDEEE